MECLRLFECDWRVQNQEYLRLDSMCDLSINMEMINRRILVRFLAIAFTCLLIASVSHAADHHHDHGAEDSQCPICHGGLAQAIPAVAVVIAAAAIQAREFIVIRFFLPSNLILANSSHRRAPPAAA